MELLVQCFYPTVIEGEGSRLRAADLGKSWAVLAVNDQREDRQNLNRLSQLLASAHITIVG